jgi:hypothetical protein
MWTIPDELAVRACVDSWSHTSFILITHLRALVKTIARG